MGSPTERKTGFGVRRYNHGNPRSERERKSAVVDQRRASRDLYALWLKAACEEVCLQPAPLGLFQ